MGALGTVGAFWGPLRGLLVALKALFGGLEVLFGDPRWPLRVWRHLLGNPRDLLEGSPGAFLGGLEMSLLDITALCFCLRLLTGLSKFLQPPSSVSGAG